MKTREEFLEMIETEDVEFIRLQFTDVWGNLKNIAVTPGQLERVLDKKFNFDGAALFDDKVSFDRDLYLDADLDSFVILPWRPQQGKVGKLICDVCLSDGTPFSFSPRTILKKTIMEAKAEGYTFLVNPECEFFLFHTDENGMPTVVSHERAGYLDVGPADFGENARRDMVLALEDMGFEVESSHHEKAPAQHEIDFAAREALDSADAVVTFRFAVRSIAKRFGLYATFMPKPQTGCAGSGMHLNIKLFKGMENLFAEKDGEVSDTAKYFIGGIMAHAQGMAAITNPIVNSYKRIGAGFEAPEEINWSVRGEKSLIKYHGAGSEKMVELRFPDSAANPYLATAVVIAAGIDGIKNKIDPDLFMKKNRKKLPGDINSAVDFMLKDKLVCDVLGDEFVKIYSAVKRNDWKEYMKQVSDWEINEYLVKM